MSAPESPVTSSTRPTSVAVGGDDAPAGLDHQPGDGIGHQIVCPLEDPDGALRRDEIGRRHDAEHAHRVPRMPSLVAALEAAARPSPATRRSPRARGAEAERGACRRSRRGFIWTQSTPRGRRSRSTSARSRRTDRSSRRAGSASSRPRRRRAMSSTQLGARVAPTASRRASSVAVRCARCRGGAADVGSRRGSARVPSRATRKRSTSGSERNGCAGPSSATPIRLRRARSSRSSSSRRRPAFRQLGSKRFPLVDEAHGGNVHCRAPWRRSRRNAP